MKQNTFSDKAMTVFSIALLAVVVALFLWLWFGSARPSASDYRTSENLQPVSVSGVSDESQTLLNGLKNNSGIPIPEPISKEGRADPFASLSFFSVNF